MSARINCGKGGDVRSIGRTALVAAALIGALFVGAAPASAASYPGPHWLETADGAGALRYVSSSGSVVKFAVHDFRADGSSVRAIVRSWTGNYHERVIDNSNGYSGSAVFFEQRFENGSQYGLQVCLVNKSKGSGEFRCSSSSSFVV